MKDGLIVTATKIAGVRQSIECYAKQVKASTPNAEKAVSVVREHQPDAVAADVDMLHSTGVAAMQSSSFRSGPDTHAMKVSDYPSMFAVPDR